VLSDPREVARRCVRLVTEGAVTAVDGSVVPMRPGSLAVRSAASGGVASAAAARSALFTAGVDVRSFA
jgi:5-oxoprolinase (ATP-hydrolysing) subunit A